MQRPQQDVITEERSHYPICDLLMFQSWLQYHRKISNTP
jgi:hypothetical protein